MSSRPAGNVSEAARDEALRAPLALPAYVEGTGPPLVMLGGGTFGAGALASHARLLAGDFTVVRLQTVNVDCAQREEPLPANYSVRMESAAMARALDELGVRTADVFGWSYGGLIALDFALNHPGMVRKLALFEPPVFWAVPPDELQSLADMRAVYELGKEIDPDSEVTDEQHLEFLAALGDPEVAVPSPDQPEWRNWTMRRAALKCLTAISRHTDDPERLKAFARPVLIMTGEATVPFHRRISAILAATFPDVQAVTLPGSHTAPITARADFLNVLRRFVAANNG